jgi:hypothetical protein
LKSAPAGDLAQIGQITVTNVAGPSGTTSDLMNVEIRLRGDVHPRGPRDAESASLVNYIFGVAPVNGTYARQRAVHAGRSISDRAIKDLLDFGIDTETGSEVIRLTVGIRFNRSDVVGKPVDSAPAISTLEVRP